MATKWVQLPLFETMKTKTKKNISDALAIWADDELRVYLFVSTAIVVAVVVQASSSRSDHKVYDRDTGHVGSAPHTHLQCTM